MQTRKLESGHVIKYYSDIDEFPAVRKVPTNQRMIEAGALDVTVADLQQRIGQAMGMNARGGSSDVNTVLMNLYYSLEAVKNHHDPDSLVFGCFIAEVDGVPVTDISETALQELVSRIQPTVSEVQEVTSDAKGKFLTPEDDTSLITLGL